MLLSFRRTRSSFRRGWNKLLPQEQDGHYPSHWRVNQSTLQQVRQLVNQLSRARRQETHATCHREPPSQLLCCCVAALWWKAGNNDARAEPADGPGWRTISCRGCAGKRWRMIFSLSLHAPSSARSTPANAPALPSIVCA
ncbi:hypothetical protein KIF59_08500 [Enterobacter cloacae subsp. cloacae]|nr:hypothetical protein [Enterobacter cloacae subsp. cloacae]